jgi:phosphoglycerate dehydrogenase-like enzyme
VTPHAAGGHDTEEVRLVDHFVANLGRYQRGAPLEDRVF